MWCVAVVFSRCESDIARSAVVFVHGTSDMPTESAWYSHGVRVAFMNERAAEPRASGASALGSESERIGEDLCKVKVKRIGRGEYHRNRIGGEGEARGDGSAAI